MELFGHFVYRGIDSRVYGIELANIETTANIKISGDLKSNTMFNRRNAKTVFTGYDYEDAAMSFEVEFVSDNGEPLNRESQRAIEKWLFNRPVNAKMYSDAIDKGFGDSYDADNDAHLYLNCRFINSEKIEGNGGVVGYKAIMETDSVMAWQDETNVSISVSSLGSAKTAVVNVDTDFTGYTYPNVHIVVGSTGGNITIVNESDSSSRLTSFTGLSAGADFYMYGNTNRITGDNYTKFSNKNFIRLLDGANKIKITGDVATIEFEWQNRRYL